MSTAADNLMLSTLARWWLPSVHDHMTSTEPAEQPEGTFQGQMFYVPCVPADGTHHLYRLYFGTDHMDSVQAGEGGYETEGLLGCLFDAQVPGTDAIRRGWRPALDDHLIAAPGENLAARGYQEEDPLGFGYPRHGNNGEPRRWVDGSEVRLAANLAAGGAICELTWKGKQFVNNWDYGRQIQIAFNLLGMGETDNPTEGGDKYGHSPESSVAPPAGWAHGSPLLAARVDGKTLTTSCHPLQWKPETFGGGPSHPVMWQGTISKRVELDWNGNPRVIHWTTTVDFPTDESYVDLEVVTAYLTADFSNLYAYNVETNDIFAMTVPMDECLDPHWDEKLRPGAGGVILATEDDSHALGIYHRATHDVPNLFGLGNFTEASGGKYGPGASKMNFLYRPGGVSHGALELSVFLVVGTVEDVRQQAGLLFANGD